MSVMATPVPYHQQEKRTDDRAGNNLYSNDAPYVVASSGDYNPNIALSQSESPLTSLVRRASSRRYQRAAREQQRPQADSTSQTASQAQYTTPIVEEEEYVSPYDDYYDTAGNQRQSSESQRQTTQSGPYATSSYGASPPHVQELDYDEAYEYNPTPTTATSQYSQYSSTSVTAQAQYPDRQMANMSLTIPHRGSGLGNTPPHSPLLHSQFARDSVATTSSSDPSYWASDSTRVSTDSRYLQAIYQEHSQHPPSNRASPGRLFNDNTSSVYSDMTSTGPALRDSWRSTNTEGPTRSNNPVRHLSHNNAVQGEVYGTSSSSPLNSPLPTVVVSSDGEYSNQGPYDSSPMRSIPLLVKPTVASTPIHESANPMHAEAMGESVTPQLPPDMREQKKAVLERNAIRNSPTPTGNRSGSSIGLSSSPGYAQSPLSKYDAQQLNGYSQQASSGYAVTDYGRPSAENGQTSSITTRERHSELQFQHQQPSMRGPATNASYSQPNQSLHPYSQSSSQAGPSSGRSSPVSVYSNYSYYQYENAIPSPTDSRHPVASQPQLSSSRSGSRQGNRTSTSEQNAAQGPMTPQDYLQLGIQHHEANRLQESARCFERSANEGGGCGVGMLMYGLTLRHGWGCAKNEKVGFKWLRKAAEYAVDDLEKVRTGGRDVDVGAVQSELVLAIYEVGQCFFHGWGVPKDQKMAVSYYAVAARLGDGDAQGDLAFCLANGKGCKKNKKEAAKWYRSAIKQGQSDVGLAWIYKDKYM
ncbi:hypothetical protein BJ165DRAFT_1491137 [Panaeolus papilionaceus]|nr:hypothetical protein BJ165DRAFT_1491137 [Panaeolus papilionaceus]